MKTTFLRTLLALSALVSSISFAQAQQTGFGNVLGQWSGDQATTDADSGVEEASYAEDAAYEEQIQGYDQAFNGGMNYGMQGGCNTCSYEGCACGDGQCGCEGGCQGDCYGCEPSNYCGDAACGPGQGMCYFEIQNIFMRAHVNDQVVGKLREKYEWSPRAVVGYESASGLGARGRYWNYERTTATVDETSSLRFEMNVIDIEGTTRFQSRRADLVLSGGFRWADMTIVEDDDDDADTQMPGITFAGDVRTAICGNCRSQWSGVCGARWSLLGGDWEGDNVLVQETFDDNVTVQELYGGVEYLCHHQHCDLYARIVFEVQNWHSDTIGENSPTDSLGFVGPAIHGGISY